MGSLLNEMIKSAERQARANRRAIISNNVEQSRNLTKTLNNTMNDLANLSKEYSVISNEDKMEYLDYYKNQLKKEKEYNYNEKTPISIEKFLKRNKVPRDNKILDFIIKNRIIIRENKTVEFTKKYYEEYIPEFQKSELIKKEEYLKRLEIENKEIQKYNHDILQKESKFLNGDRTEVEFLVNSALSDNLISLSIDVGNGEKKYSVSDKVFFNEKDKVLNLDTYMIAPSIFSLIPKNVKFNSRTFENQSTYYSNRQLNKFYNMYMGSIALIRLYMISSIFSDVIKFININIKVNGNNPYNGKLQDINLLSMFVPTADLANINIKSADPQAILKKYSARISPDAISLIPVEEINCTPNVIEKNSLDNINYNLDGFAFEYFAKDLLIANGFDRVEVTKASGDYGADVIAYKDDIKYAIQCKKFSSKVGTKAVQEVIGSLYMYNCHVGVVLTNNYFTPNAVELARKNNILLWDRDKLSIMLSKLDNKKMD